MKIKKSLLALVALCAAMLAHAARVFCRVIGVSGVGCR